MQGARLKVSTCIGGFHVTSSPPCWWTVNKRSLISALCLSTSICSFHHCYLRLPRLHENHLCIVGRIVFPPNLQLKYSGKLPQKLATDTLQHDICNAWRVQDLTNTQGCALRKIEGSPVLWNCKIQGAQHMICMKTLRFSSRPRAKVRRQGPPGSARAQPWYISQTVINEE